VAELRYHLVTADVPAEAVLRFIFESLGIQAEPREPPGLWEGPHVVYGNSAPVGPRGISITDRPGDVLWPDIIDGATDVSIPDGHVPFDLVRAIGALLRDEVHDGLGTDTLDPHGRLTYASSMPARAGYGDRPIVNLYIAFLGRLLRERLGLIGRPRWPVGKIAAIGLSHDVDMPDRYAFLESSARPWRLRRSPRTYLRTSVRLARARLRDPRPDDYWLFDQVAESERRSGFSSTFFFATVPFHREEGAPQDVAYDVGRPAFRKVLRSLRESGFEIGLHASYRAYELPARLATERARMSEVADADIRGVRHHYWHLGPDIARTLRGHEQAGFAYDSSLAFNDHVGFRRSVALPFPPFDAVLGRPLRTLQLPTFCMDGNLFYKSADVDAAVVAVSGLIDRIADTGGFGAIDWHIQTSFPGNPEYFAWGTAYQQILGLLAARRDIWTTSLGSAAAWARERSALSPDRAEPAAGVPIVQGRP
jgi:hypothetical protein